MGELLFVFNDMSKTSLESKVYSKVGQSTRNLKGIKQTINKDERVQGQKGQRKVGNEKKGRENQI